MFFGFGLLAAPICFVTPFCSSVEPVFANARVGDVTLLHASVLSAVLQ